MGGGGTIGWIVNFSLYKSKFLDVRFGPQHGFKIYIGLCGENLLDIFLWKATFSKIICMHYYVVSSQFCSNLDPCMGKSNTSLGAHSLK